MAKLNDVYILAGSNHEPEKNLQLGVKILGEYFNIVTVSPVYETLAVGGSADDPHYLNAAIFIETFVILEFLQRRLRQIEATCGRVRFDADGNKSKIVTLDLDILLFNHEVSQSIVAPLPHPDILNHAHAIIPLADIAPDFIHPVTKKKMKEIATHFQNKPGLKRRDDILPL